MYQNFQNSLIEPAGNLIQHIIPSSPESQGIATADRQNHSTINLLSDLAQLTTRIILIQSINPVLVGAKGVPYPGGSCCGCCIGACC